MGIIRDSLLVITCVLLFIGFLSAGCLYSISKSLEYQNIKKELIPIVSDIVNENVNLTKVIEKNLPFMKEYCKNNSYYIFEWEKKTINISCESVFKGPNEVVEETISNAIEEVYYSQYNCSFIECFKESGGKPFFLVSKESHDYFDSRFNLSLMICLFLSIILFFLIKNKINIFLLIGSILVIASLPFIKLENFISLFADKSIMKFTAFLFKEAFSASMTMLIAGIILILIGVFFKFFDYGFKINRFIQKISEKFKKKNQEIDNSKKNSEVIKNK